jgi:hypothetical protein
MFRNANNILIRIIKYIICYVCVLIDIVYYFVIFCIIIIIVSIVLNHDIVSLIIRLNTINKILHACKMYTMY